MPYRLSFDEQPADGLRRCAREQISNAIEQLDSGRADDPVNAVHEARKSLKKTRAALRLARPSLSNRAYRRYNRELRDAGREVSAVRDADVMVETVDKLRDRFVGHVPAKTFTAARRRLARAASARVVDEDSVAALVEDLRRARQHVDEWPLDGFDWRAVRRGAELSYRSARKAGAIAAGNPSAENRHEWRKRVKDHWYHQRLLREAWPALLDAQAKEAHALADALGDDHDLTVLAGVLADDDAALLELAAHRRDELIEVAAGLGQRLFAERPKAYRRRLKRYMKAGRLDQPAAAVA